MRPSRLQAWIERLARSAPGAWLLRQSLRLAPDSPPARRGLMRRHARRDEWEQAVGHARALVRADPADSKAQLVLARGLQRLHLHAEVIEVLQALVGRDPSQPEAWERLGRSLLRLRRHAEARPCLERALPHARDRVRVLQDLAEACLGTQDLERHRELCLEARALVVRERATPERLERWVQLELALGDEGRPVEALTAALRELPRNAERDARHLVLLASFEPLPDELAALAEALARDDARLAWIAPISRLIRAGKGSEAAAELRRLDPLLRRAGAWSALMRAAEPGHFADAALPAPRAGGRRAGDLAVVACFFDPVGSHARLRNFAIFHRRLQRAGVPLLVVELAFDGQPFRLDGVEDVLRIRGGSLLWQKERLLNLGIARLLAQGWKKIAWLDADVVFEADDWAEHASRVLDDVNLCQLFSLAHRRQTWRDAGAYHAGSIFRVLSPVPSRARLGHTGLAWAARAELLERVPLYDAGVLGSGDLWMLAAAWPEPRSPAARSMYEIATANMPPAMRAHYERWAAEWRGRVAGRLGFAELFVQSLYHGPLALRRYYARGEILGRHAFSPEQDLVLDPGGAWRWGSDKPALHREVAAYFEGRSEDDGLLEARPPPLPA
jgi:tetratricopeptide (TPR) repeat protein